MNVKPRCSDAIFAGLAVFVLTVLPTISRAQSNLFLMVSQSGDYIGQGQTYVTTNPANFSVSGNAATFGASAFGYGATFDGPDSTDLTVGEYPGTTRWPFNGSSPGLDISGNGRGCNNDCGYFRIYELHVTGGAIDRLWVTFSNRCECFNAPLTGEIRFNSQLAPAEPVPRTLHVPSEYPTIQAAMNAASLLALDTVLVSPGVYNEAVDFLGKRIILASVAGPSQTVITFPSGTGVNFSHGEISDATIQGFSITNCSTGINVSSSSPTVISNVVFKCGTGINCNFASPTIRSNSVLNCSGNGLYLGGAASQVIEGNIIRSNATGIAMFAAGSPLIRNSIIQGSGGDGLNMVNQSDATIVQCEIYENGANGINWLTPSGTRGPWVINCTIFNNHSAGIYADGYDAGARIMNSILMGSPALSVGGFNDNNPPIVQYNDIYSRTGAAYAGLISDLTGTAGNISADPLFVCEPSRDFHLLAGSPALDRGTNGAPNVASLDFDGFPRVMDGDTNGVAVVDLGAFELNPAALPQPCLYVVCPSNINVTAPQGQNFAVVNYPTPTATPSAALVTSPASGSAFPSGTTIVTSTATYGTNSVNCSFNVTVSVWPAIVSQPQSTNTLAGRNFSLSVTATGTAPLSYSWNFEGVAIAGATGTTLTVTNAQAANEGVYRVVAANAAGAVSSSAALVRVLPSAPLIVSGPSSLSIPSGSNATFNVSSIGSAPIFYQWLKGGVPLPGATTSQLTVFNAQLPDAGGYQVVVSNATGSATSTVASLSITPAAPAFVLQPLDKAVNAGTNTSLIAQARGSEPIVYQWRQNGVILSGATQTTLNLSNVTITSSGTYDVVATNVYGMATSGVAIVTVSQKPTLLSGLTNQIVDVGSTVILPVAASGSGILTYFWQFNGALLANTNSSLTLSNIQIFQSGYYRVTVSNTLGTISTTGRISVVNVSSRLVVWGDNSGGQLNVPVNLNDASLVAGGDYHSLALRHDGTLLAWGYAGDGQTAVPTNALKFVTIAAGAAHNLAVTEAGSVSAWGRNESGQTNVPVSATNVVAVAAGDSHSLALLSSGNLLAWGNNAFGQGSAVQFSGIRAIAAGRNHNLALRTNGTVSAWGYNAYGQASPPQTLTGVAAISAGYLHSVALLTNRTVVCWGDNSFGQTNQPAGLSNVVSVAAGDFHTFALRSDGSVVAWGDNSYGQTALPVSLSNSVFVASGNYHGLALVPSMVLQYRKDTSGLVLQWSGPGVLQRAASLSGPYQDVTGSPGPYTNHSTPAPGLFFRLRSP